MPLDAEELEYHLERAAILQSVLRETPELRAIRESLVLPKIVDAFMPGEDPWLAKLRFAVFRAVRDVWMHEPHAAVAEAKANWLISVLPDPMEWCVDPENEAIWTTARHQAAIQAGLLMVFIGTDKSRRDQYFDWLERQVLAPLRTNQPELWDTAVEFVKGYIPRLMVMEHDKER